jgi:hypothetical protein
MRNNNISLSYNCYGKTITIKHDTSVLRGRDLFGMFKTIVVSEFGEENWKELLLVLGDEELSKCPTHYPGYLPDSI